MCPRRNEREPCWSRTARWRAAAGGAGRARARATTSPAEPTSCGHTVRRQLRCHSHSLGVTNFTDTHRMVCAALSAFCMHVACSRITWPACCTHAGRSCEVSDDLTTSSTSVAGAPHCRSRLYAGACRQSAELTARCAWQVVSRPVRCVHDVLRLGRLSRTDPRPQQASASNPHLHPRQRCRCCARMKQMPQLTMRVCWQV